MSHESEASVHVLETHDRLARIETKIDTLITDRKDHEKRIRSVERNVWWVSGAAAVVGWFLQPWLKSKGLM
jgi:hypothetical protein